MNMVWNRLADVADHQKQDSDAQQKVNPCWNAYDRKHASYKDTYGSYRQGVGQLGAHVIHVVAVC